MRKKILMLGISFISVFSIAYTYHINSVMKANDSTDDLSINFLQYSQLQLDENKVYTAIDSNGNFLSNQNSVSDPVDYPTTISPISDARVPAFITNTKLPEYAELQSSISSEQLNENIPKTTNWWLKDTTSINGIQSARYVTSDNKLNGTDYGSGNDSDQWRGYLPIETKSIANEYVGNLYSADDASAPYTSVTGEYKYFAPGEKKTFPLCSAVVYGNELQPCSAENTQNYVWSDATGFVLGIVTLNTADKTLILSTPNGNTVHPGDLVAIGEIDPWGAANGFSLMVLGGTSDIIATRNSEETFSIAQGKHKFNNVHVGSYYSSTKAEKQTAFIRPLINIDKAKIAYLSEVGSTITTNTYQPLVTDTESTKNYIAHVIDQSLNMNSLQEFDDQGVLYDAKSNTIKIPQNTTSFTMPITTSSLNEGYQRYVSAAGNNVSGSKVFGQINEITNKNAITFDVSTFIDTTKVGSKNTIQLYVEDINANKTSYISEGFSVNLEVVEGFGITYTAKPQNINGSVSTVYEYKQNVFENDKIGELSFSKGVKPYTLSLKDDSTNSGAYQYFKLSESTNISSDLVDLLVDTGSSAINPITNSLNAGTYKFCIVAKDSSTKQDTDETCIEMTVNKTKASIAFENPKTTKISMSDAKKGWGESASGNPTSETKIKYSKSGGSIGLINIDVNTGAITYSGTGYGTVKVKATVDDDPSTGKDNYISSYIEKEIIIYREVDGSVTPDSASNDSIIPSFSASDSNIKTGGTIGTITGSKGTPDTIDGSTTTYTYGLKNVDDHDLFEVNSTTGVITTKANLGVDSYTITVTVSDQWSTKEIPVTINVGVSKAEALKFYENNTSNTVITTKTVTLNDTGVTVYATVKGSTNTNPVTYKIKDSSTNVITVNPTSGAVTIKGAGTVTVVAEKEGESGQAKATTELTFTVTAGTQNLIYTDQAGNELEKTSGKYKAMTNTYGLNKKFQLYTKGSPTGASITYALKDNDPALQDVISVNSNTGEVTIRNASLSAQIGKIIVVATSHDPSGNYKDISIELPINISKGTRTVTFADDPINVINGIGTVTPVVKVDGIVDTSTTYSIEVDASEDSSIAWTTNRTTIEYDYTDAEGKDIKINVTKNADRNYEIANGTGTLHIMGADESALTTTSPGKVVYGKTFSIESTQDDSLSTNVKYTFIVNDTTYISTPAVNGNKAEFDALKYSGNTETEIAITRTADGEQTVSKRIKVKVLPKDIKIKINDQEKLKGETNPTLTCQEFNSQLVSWNGVKDVIQKGDVKLSTTATATSAKGGYPITGDHAYLNKTYPNYSFTFTNGTLKVNEEVIEDNWYHLELDDGMNTIYNGKWTNKDVNIISDHDEYVNVSKDQSTWTPNKVTVNTEGNTEQSFWLKKASGAITGEKKETILIDKTAPTLTSVTAKDSRNQLQVLISTLSNGFFFRPNTTFEIATSDVKEKLAVSGTSSIDYKLYDSDKKLIKQDTLSVTKEKASLTIQETTGTYQLCMILKDQAGNESGELCKSVDLKEIGQDSDGDGIPDINIDTDGDGKPDLNITKKQCDDLDEDRDCKIPYLNIDTIGDGQPDMNIDTDGDGTPDLNTGIVKEWKPDTLVDLDKDNKPDYKTSSTLKGLNNIDTDGDHYPDLNIDRDLDGIPELNINTDGKLDKPQTNIDGNGDGIANINIDENGDGIPEKNVMDITEWKPEHNVTSDGKIIYDTMKLTFKEVDELEDNGIKVQPSDPNVSFLPNMALKVDDITANTSEDTKKDIIKDSGETDKEVKKVYDVKLLEDNKVIQPDGSLKVSIPVDETVQNAKVMMKAKDGTWKVMEVKVENGYYVFETDYIGEVSVIGDPEVSDVKEPTQTPEPNPDGKDTATTNPTVQGTYTTGTKATYPGNNTGGASTGDHTSVLLYLGMSCLTFVLLRYMKKRIG